MKSRVTTAAGALILAAACSPEQPTEGVLATVDDYTLPVDDAVELLVDQERLSAEDAVVRSLAELWIDYTLLAEAAAEDSTFSQLDLEPLVVQQLSQVMVFQLRDSVIQVDTFVTEDELRAMYESEAPAVEVRARHIMLTPPPQASAAQQDSVLAILTAVRERATAGDDFASLARQFSQDPGTALDGGDLGFFRRGDMVEPFEEAVFALSPGEISDVVETPMGYHLVLLEDRRVQGFGDVSSEYREAVQGRMVQEAESVYVAALVDRVQPAVSEGAAEVAREVAANPGAQLTGTAERRELVEWDGGSLTVRDLRQVMQLEPPPLREGLSQGSDEDVEAFLMSIAHRDLLVGAAEAEGLRPPPDSIRALVDDARAQLRTAARVLGLLDLDQAPGEDVEIAVARAVQEALADNLSGATQVVPLGIVSFQLRERRSTNILDAGVGEVIVDVAQIRAARAMSPLEETLDSALTSTDPTGR